MKNFLFLTTVSILTLSSVAIAKEPEDDYSGFYIAPHVGYSMTSLLSKGKGNQVKMGMNGVMGGLSIGYMKMLNPRIVVGGELSSSLLNDGVADWVNRPGNHYSQRTRMKYMNNVSLKAGYLCKGVMPYLKAGWSFAGVSDHVQRYSPERINVIKKETRNGPLVGLGVETPINDKIGIGGEMIYTFYRKDIPKDQAKVNYTTGLFSLYLSYKFSSLGEGINHSQEQHTINPEGFYVAPMVGYAIANATQTFSDKSQCFKKGPSGLIGGINVGYMKMLNPRFALGGELSAALSDVSVSDVYLIPPPEIINFKQKWTTSLSLKAGYIWNNVLSYLKAGWSFAGFQYHYERGPNEMMKKRSSHGPLVGLGMETPINEKLTIGGEFTYTFYKKTKYGYFVPPVIKNHYHTRVGTFSMFLSYKI